MKKKLETSLWTKNIAQNSQKLYTILDEQDKNITQDVYVFSEQLGKITIYNPYAKVLLHEKSELNNIDSHLTSCLNQFKKDYHCKSGSIPFLKALRYLNRNGEQLVTGTTKATFFDIFKELVDPEQRNTTTTNPPRLVFTSSKFVTLFSPSRMYGTTLSDGTILIAVDKTISFETIFTSILHEISCFSNCLNPNFDLEIDIDWIPSNSEMNEFIAFASEVKPTSLTCKSIIKDLQTIISGYGNANELTARFCTLLIKYNDASIQESLTFLLESATSSKAVMANEIIRQLNNIFPYIDKVRKQCSVTLFRFVILQAKEFLYSDIAEGFGSLEALKTNTIELEKEAFEDTTDNWEKILDKIFDIQFATEELAYAASLENKEYSLHKQVKVGDEKSIRTILQYIPMQINAGNGKELSPLAVAVIHDNSAMFNLLLKFGASIHWSGRIDGVLDCSLLHLAAFCGSFELIPVLLTLGLNANQLNKNNQPPISMLVEWLDDNSSAEYNRCLLAMAQLLGHSHVYTYKNSDSFQNELELFRRNVSILYVLCHRGNFTAPEEIIHSILSQLENPTFYKDLFRVLWNHPELFKRFINIGYDVLYHEFKLAMRPEISSMEIAKKKLSEFLTRETPPQENQLVKPAEPEEIKTLLNYYTPRGNHSAALSLASVTLAQKEMRTTPSTTFFKNEKRKERRTLITHWKEKAINHEDDGLYQALLQIFKELGTHSISTPLYHLYAGVLEKMIIKENKTYYTEPLFIDEFKQNCNSQRSLSESANSFGTSI